MILRGSSNKIEPSALLVEKLISEKWTWSAHTHVKPGDLNPSGLGKNRKIGQIDKLGDRDVLVTLDQEQSLLLDSLGHRKVFTQDPVEFMDPTPKNRG